MATNLEQALRSRENACTEAIDRLRELATDDTEDEVHDLTRILREAVELARCMRRSVPHMTPSEIHRAFGAPGDWGYHTPIGDALARIYSGEK